MMQSGCLLNWRVQGLLFWKNSGELQLLSDYWRSNWHNLTPDSSHKVRRLPVVKHWRLIIWYHNHNKYMIFPNWVNVFNLLDCNLANFRRWNHDFTDMLKGRTISSIGIMTKKCLTLTSWISAARCRMFWNSTPYSKTRFPISLDLTLRIPTSLDLMTRIQRIFNNGAWIVAVVCHLMANYDATLHIVWR